MEIPSRGFSDVLTFGMHQLRRVWRPLVPISFGAFMVIGAVSLVLLRATGVSDIFDLVLNDPDTVEAMSTEEMADLLAELMIGFGWISVVNAIGAGFVALAAHRLVASDIAGESVSAGAAGGFAAKRLLPFLGASVVALVAIFGGLILLILPGIWIAGALSMISPVIAIERSGSIDSLRRSYFLVHGRWWPTIGFLLLVGLLGSVAGQLVIFVGGPLLTIGATGLGLGLAYVLSVVVQGFIVAGISVMATVWYIDLRARKEVLLTESLA